MKEIMNNDKIAHIDFDSAFPETPSVIHRAVLNARDDIIRYERRKLYFRNIFTAVAACLLVVAGAAVFFIRSGGNSSDIITPPALTSAEIAIDMETPVFASRTDPYYHSDAGCALAGPDCVELPLITAIEFEKTACSLCASELNTGNRIMNAESDISKAETDVAEREATVSNELKPKEYSSEGALKQLDSALADNLEPVYHAEFFGGNLNVYAIDEENYIGYTDPSPDDEVFHYILIGRREISAEEYFEKNGGAGEYEKYDPEDKQLIAAWGDAYDTHTCYSSIIEVENREQNTGMCAWRMNREQYEDFKRDATLTVAVNKVFFQPALSAALW